MKIRTGFVTNSSSASSIDISIDNPVLLEILQRYKDMGVFGDAEIKFEIGKGGSGSKTEAFTMKEESDGTSTLGGIHVASVGEVIYEIIEVMEDENFVDDLSGYDQELYKQLKEELQLRKEELDGAYLSIDWNAMDWSWGSEKGEPGEEKSYEFHFDPVNGEKYSVELWEDEEDQ